MAFLTGYIKRKAITIDQTKVDAELTDFPVLVKLSASNFDFAEANADGFDIRFTSDDGETLLKYERERHDSANSLAEYWVKVPSVSDTVDTVIYIYYRTTDTADGADPENVWDTNFLSVWHLNDNTTSSSLDSVATPHNLTKKGANEPIQIDGKIGKGQDFDGTDDYLKTANDPYSNANFASGMTVSVLFKTAAAAYQYLLDDEAYSVMGLSLAGHENKLFCSNDGGFNFLYSSADMNDDAWHVATMVWDGTTNSNLYIDGAYVGAVASADPTPDDPTRPFVIGSHSTLVNPFDGLIDETRISKVARSAAYIKADYNSLFNSLVAYGSEETVKYAPTVTTQAATSITPTSAVGNGNVTSDGQLTITERGVCWSTSADPTTADDKQTATGTTGAFTANMTSLTPETLYHYRAYATNAMGTSYGADTEFTTTALAAPTVTTQAVSDITAISAIGNGTIIDDGGATITERGVCWSTSLNPTTADSKATSVGTTGAFTASIIDLVEETIYHVRAYAINSVGTSYGDDVTFETLPVSLIDIVTKGNTQFAVDDILRIKDGLNDEWLKVYEVTDASHYKVSRDKAGSYAPDNNPTWKKGATIVNYGQSGKGGIYMTASEANAPYLSVFDHSGLPWSDVRTRLRLGNLNGYLGYVDDLYGIGIGDSNAYLKYDVVNGLRIKGDITVVGGNVVVTGGAADDINAGTTTIDGGKITANSITAAKIAANSITANELSTALVYAGTIEIATTGNIHSGQTAYETGTGWFIGHVGGTPKLSIGTTDNYFKFDGQYVKIKGSFDVGEGGLINNAVYTVANLPVSPQTLPSGAGVAVPSAYE